MVLIGIVSAKGSPGVTTSALAMASVWPRPALMIDADPFGGDVRAGLGAGSWPPASGLAEVVVDLRTTGIEQALHHRVHQPWRHCPPVLAGLGCVGQAASVPWDRIAWDLRGLHDADHLVDCGRFVAVDGVVALLRRCDVIVLVTRSSLRAARAAARVAPLLREELGVGEHDPRVAVVVVAPDAPYSGQEIADGCRAPLLTELPDDPRAAAVWSEGARPGRGFTRSRLQRAAAAAAERLVDARLAGRGAA